KTLRRPSGPHAFEAFVDGDTCQPGAEARASFEVPEVLERLEERRLRGVFRICRVPGDAQQDPVQPAMVASHERLEGRSVTACGSSNQVNVRVARRLVPIRLLEAWMGRAFQKIHAS